jgi:hypothetical protein
MGIRRQFGRRAGFARAGRTHHHHNPLFAFARQVLTGFNFRFQFAPEVFFHHPVINQGAWS